MTKSGTSAINVQIRDMNSLYTSWKTWIIMTALLTLFDIRSDFPQGMDDVRGRLDEPLLSPDASPGFVKVGSYSVSEKMLDSAWFWRIERQNVRKLRSFRTVVMLSIPTICQPHPHASTSSCQPPMIK